MEKVIISSKGLSLEDVIKVARGKAIVSLDKESKKKINQSNELVNKLLKEKRVVYGVSTGFGKFADVVIDDKQSELLQRNLIISHAVGYGEALEEDVVRAMLVLRINSLSKGYSGIRLSTLEVMVEMLNKNVVPFIPCKGSLGASGDLVPLAHMALVLIGLGKAYYQGELMDGHLAMKKAGIETVNLQAKEGLALINGTQCMCALACLATYDALNLNKVADIVGALSFEAQNGIIDALQERLHKLRKQKGQIDSAYNLRMLLKASKNVSRQGELRVQDAYSLRCMPIVHGASKDGLNYIKEIVENEINAVTDNPLLFTDDQTAISGGNFHGQPLALALDHLKIVQAELANISERRIERLLNPSYSNLPAFLTSDGGICSGFMIAQYSAAALVSENKVLAHPASVDSIPTSAGQEDHVSMGTIAARQAYEIGKNVSRVLATEYLINCQGIDMRKDRGMGIGTNIAYKLLRKKIKTLKEDRELFYDLEYSQQLIDDGSLVKEVEKALGKALR